MAELRAPLNCLCKYPTVLMDENVVRRAGFALYGRRGCLTDKAIWGRGCLRSSPYAPTEVILICQPRAELWSIRGLWVVHPMFGGSLMFEGSKSPFVCVCACTIFKRETCGPLKLACVMNKDAAARWGKNSTRYSSKLLPAAPPGSPRSQTPNCRDTSSHVTAAHSSLSVTLNQSVTIWPCSLLAL